MLARVFDGWAGPAVLAIPSVPIEEDEMYEPCVVDRFIDPNQSLDGGSRSAFLEWVKLDDPCNLPFRRRLW
jgi:hypothetical protein